MLKGILSELELATLLDELLELLEETEELDDPEDELPDELLDELREELLLDSVDELVEWVSWEFAEELGGETVTEDDLAIGEVPND